MDYNDYLQTVIQYGLLIGLIGGSVSMLSAYLLSSLLHCFWVVSK